MSELVDQLGALRALREPLERAEGASALANHPDVAPAALWQAAATLHAQQPAKTTAELDQCALVDAQLMTRFGEDEGDIQRPSSLAEAVALVERAVAEGFSLRAVGSARSLSDAPAPAGSTLMVSTCCLAASLPVHAELLADPSRARWLYRCGAGRTVKAILQELDPHPGTPMKRALENLGAGQFQAVVGALSTSTHGSGLHKPSFPQLVAALEWVTVAANGTVVVEQLEPSPGHGALSDPKAFAAAHLGAEVEVHLVQDDERFQAALVSLGCLGLITSVTLRLVPGFFLHEVRQVRWWSQVRAELDTLLSTHDYFELVFDPFPTTRTDGTVDHAVLTSARDVVDTQTRTGGRPVLMEVGTTELGRLASAVLLERALFDPARRAPENVNTAVHASQVSGYTDESYRVLQLDLDVNADSTEQTLPIARAAEALDAVVALVQERLEAWTERFPSEPTADQHDALCDAWRALAVPTSPLGVRFVPADDAPMSQFYRRVSCTIEAPMPGSDMLDARVVADPAAEGNLVQLYRAYLDGRRGLFQALEQRLQQQVDARPHWGQANYLDLAATQALFVAFDQWLAVYFDCNHHGTFNGALTERLGISLYPAGKPPPAGSKLAGEAVFLEQKRPSRGVLHLHGALAKGLYEGLTQPVVPERCQMLFPDRCRRLGVSLVVSTQGFIEPFVCEVGISPLGKVVARGEDDGLFNPVLARRHPGRAALHGERLSITGEAADALRAFVDAGRADEGAGGDDAAPVLLRLVDLSRGELVVEQL